MHLFPTYLLTYEWNILIKTKFGVNQNTKQCFFCIGFNRGAYENWFSWCFRTFVFSGLAFICLFLNQVKSLSDVDCNFEIIVSVSGGKVTTVVTCASMKEVLPKLPLW